MKCPKCSKEMKIIAQDISNNYRTGDKYDRTVYNCPDCDTWANTEIPFKK